MRLDVEFLGQARRLAQTKECLVDLPDQASFRNLLARLASLYPALVGPVIVPETFDLVSAYILNVDGRLAVRHLDDPAQDGQRVLLMFVEAGG